MSPTTTRTRPAPSTPSRKRAGMDPRVAARRTAVTREQGRRRLRLAGVLLVATALLVGGWFLIHSSLFSVRVVTVIGAVHESEAQVEAAAGIAGHQPLIDVDTGTAALGIERLPWVGAAAVSLHWPDGVHISVTEEVPRLVMSAAGGRWAVLGADGRILEVMATRAPGLVLVTGPQVPGSPGSTVGSLDQAGVRVASTLPPSFGAQVTAVHVEQGGWVQLAMTTPITVDIGSATQLSAKYEDVTALLSGVTLHDGDVIDVSVPKAPTVTAG